MVVDGGQYLAGCFAGRVGRPREARRHSGYLDMAEVVAVAPEVIAIMPCGFDIEQVWCQTAGAGRVGGMAAVFRRAQRAGGDDRWRPVLQSVRTAVASASSKNSTATRVSTSRSRWSSTRKSDASSRRTWRCWRMRLEQFDRDLQQEPGRIRRSTRCRHGVSSRSASCTSGRRRIEAVAAGRARSHSARQRLILGRRRAPDSAGA